MFVLLISFEKDVTRMCLKRKLKNQFLQIFTLVSHKEPKTRGKYLVNSEFKFAFMFSKRQVDIFERYSNLTYKNYIAVYSCLSFCFVFFKEITKTGKFLKFCCFLKRMSETIKSLREIARIKNKNTLSIRKSIHVIFHCVKKTKGKIRVEKGKLKASWC